MAKEVAQLVQAWLPTQPAADSASQQRIRELGNEIAKMKSSQPDLPTTTDQLLHCNEVSMDKPLPQFLIRHLSWLYPAPWTCGLKQTNLHPCQTHSSRSASYRHTKLKSWTSTWRRSPNGGSINLIALQLRSNGSASLWESIL